MPAGACPELDEGRALWPAANDKATFGTDYSHGSQSG
jgi:hypothetical protein